MQVKERVLKVQKGGFIKNEENCSQLHIIGNNLEVNENKRRVIKIIKRDKSWNAALSTEKYQTTNKRNNKKVDETKSTKCD